MVHKTVCEIFKNIPKQIEIECVILKFGVVDNYQLFYIVGIL